MFLKKDLQHPDLAPYLQAVAEGRPLFRQGESGDCMYIITEGIIQLYDDSGAEPHLIGTFGPGQFFGEKCLASTITKQRAFSAIAQTDSKAIGIRQKDIPALEKIIPGFLFDLFQEATERLESGYHMIRVMRTNNELEKMLHVIIHFYRCPGLPPEIGANIPMTAADIHHLSGIPRNIVDNYLEMLCEREVLTKGSAQGYLLKDEPALLHFLTRAREE
jgi:CRP-like cAMP-binding protein